MEENQLSSSLEDYLETIYTLVREAKVARVRDIARARGVRAASVTHAMKRLDEMGLVRYAQREYIDLTPEGERAARRILSRHQILARFFEEILKVSPDRAAEDACAMEHSLSQSGMEHLVRLFEFLCICPEGKQFLDRFHSCPVVHGDAASGGCDIQCPAAEGGATSRVAELRTLAEMAPGERARVAQVTGVDEHRGRLLDMGLLPDVRVAVTRVDEARGKVWIRLGGFEVEIDRERAGCVSVSPRAEDGPANGSGGVGDLSRCSG